MSDGSVEIFLFLNIAGDVLLEQRKNDLQLMLQKLKLILDSKAANNIWDPCESHASLSSAAHGSMLWAAPFSQTKPVGLFIHPLAAMTKVPLAQPANPTSRPVNQ